jgi:DNA-binding NtrC family response regulator
VGPRPRGTVLLADDEPLLLRLLSRVLGRRGFEVRTAASEAELRAALADPAGLAGAVIDATLLRRLGAEALRGALRARPGLGLVLVSGAEPEPTLAALLDEAGGRFLAKPFEPGRLLRALEEVLGGGVSS